MIRILHTADWHLGQTFFGYDRAEEHKAFLDWLAEEIRQNEIDALVIAGDVFDVSNPSAPSRLRGTCRQQQAHRSSPISGQV